MPCAVNDCCRQSSKAVASIATLVHQEKSSNISPSQMSLVDVDAIADVADADADAVWPSEMML